MTGGLLIDFVNSWIGLGSGPRAAYLLGAAYYIVAMFLLRPVVEPDRRSATREASAVAA